MERASLDAAIEHDARVREIDRVVRESWSELAAICIQVRDNREWQLLPPRPILDAETREEVLRPYHSFDEWLLDAAPVCKQTVYTGMGIMSVLAQDLNPADIAEMEIGNAKILAHDVKSSAVRRDPEIIAAAKSGRHTKTLRDLVKAKYPDQHIEDIVTKKLHFTATQWMVIERGYDAFLVLEPYASLEVYVEWMAAELEGS